MQVSAMASNASVYTLAIFAPALLRGRGKNLLVGEFPNPPHMQMCPTVGHIFLNSDIRIQGREKRFPII